MDGIAWVVGLSLAIGIGLISYSLLGGTVEFGQRMVRLARMRTSRIYALGIHNEAVQQKQRTEMEILGLDRIPWTQAYVLAGIAGLGLFAILSVNAPGIAPFFLALPGGVYAVQRYLIHQRRRFLDAQVRQLLIDARLRMSLYGSLLLGLENIAATTVEESLVYTALKRQFVGGTPKSSLDVLQAMAVELKAASLQRTVQRLRSAQQAGGTMDLDLALKAAMDEITEELNTSAEEQMNKLPLRITLLAMPLLLVPIIVLLFYPLVDRVLSTLAGMPVGGGF